MKTLGARIKFARDHVSLSQQKFADMLDISRESIAKYETDKIMAGGQVFLAIYQHTGVNPTWLLTGDGNPFGCSSTQQEDIELCMIPLVAASLSAGNGSFEVDGNIEKYLAFRRDFLRAKGSIKDMVLMTVAGDSMSPDILHKDTVLIDQSQKRFVADGIYAVGFGETIYLKKINALPNKIVLESINKQYEPIIIEQHEIEDSVRILGRAIWWCREAG